MSAQAALRITNEPQVFVAALVASVLFGLVARWCLRTERYGAWEVADAAQRFVGFGAGCVAARMLIILLCPEP